MKTKLEIEKEIEQQVLLRNAHLQAARSGELIALDRGTNILVLTALLEKQTSSGTSDASSNLDDLKRRISEQKELSEKQLVVAAAERGNAERIESTIEALKNELIDIQAVCEGERITVSVQDVSHNRLLIGATGSDTVQDILDNYSTCLDKSQLDVVYNGVQLDRSATLAACRLPKEGVVVTAVPRLQA